MEGAIIVALVSMVFLMQAITALIVRKQNGKSAEELDRVIRLFEDRERKRRAEVSSQPLGMTEEAPRTPFSTLGEEVAAYVRKLSKEGG